MNSGVILIHGNNTLRWNYTWIPWLAKELREQGIGVAAETMPDSILARREYWTAFLQERLHVNENDILVGHSSGADCAMHYAEQHRIRGSVLVSPCHTHLSDKIEKQSGYYDTPCGWKDIRNSQEFIIQFGSRDDPCISADEFRHIHTYLQSEYHEFTDRRHFYEGQDTFPELYKKLQTYI